MTKKILTNFLGLLLLTLLLGACAPLRAPSSVPEDVVYYPPKRELSEVHARLNSEEFHALKDVKVVYANYPLIKRDFPALRHLSDAEIDEWLIKNGAFISRPNATTTAANSPINYDKNAKVSAHRPPRYGRAAVFSARFEGAEVGLLDAKGVGHFLNARATPKGDGLASLGELIREVLYERLMAMILKDSGSERGVVGSYAILDPGFKVKFGDGATKPAGILLRQAHDRQTDHGFISSPQERYDLAAILKKYGLITHNNLQGTKRGDLFDFGHMYIEVTEGDEELGPRSEKWSYHPEYLAGLSETDQFSPSVIDNPGLAANELAEKLAQGAASREDVRLFLEERLGEVKVPSLQNQLSCYEILKRLMN